jgi:lipid II:glycine glycyltransferase (peptidoglycan interpeptide bridge formation enzyme)
MIRKATEEEINKWDELVRSNPDGGHIYNSFEWNEFKKTVGWQPHYLIFEQAGYVMYFCIAEKSASFLGTIYYCAKGPGIFKDFKPDKASEARFKEFCKELKSYISIIDRKAILVKVEPEIHDSSCDMHQFGLHKSSSDLQFKATIFVDLRPSDEEILAGFKQKTRYNINLARRKGVEIKQLPMTDENVDLMFSMMSATQSRAGFFLRKKEYFAMYWKILADANMGQLLAAYHESDVLAGIFATSFGTKGYYKDGGSYPLKRNLMAPYLLQWEAMRWAKEQGATSYDLVAVPPKAHLDDPEHPQAGLYQFKRGFNDDVTEFVGCWDLPISETKYKIWKRQERKFLKLYTKMTKNLFW